MKIHTKIIKKKHSNLERLDTYFYKSKEVTYLYSHEGIFIIDGNTIGKCSIIDHPITEKPNYFQDETLLVDPSVIKIDYTNQQIPYSHEIIKKREMNYRLRENAMITFRIELVDNEIFDYYFITKENIDNYSIKTDIDTFLSLLK